MKERLTYSDLECSSYLYFSFYADLFDTKIISDQLGIKPTSVMIKKDPTPKSTSWNYKIEAGNDINLESYLEELVNLFKPKIEIINRLKSEFKLETRIQFVIEIDTNPNISTPYFGINKRVIHFLNKTDTEIDFDLYKVNCSASQ